MKMEATPRFNIDTCSMIVEFNASVWTARKLDRKVTDEVNTNKHAASDASRVNKHLLAGRNELEQISKFVAATRGFVYDNTLPWSDNGQRLLPTLKFLDFDKRMSEARDQFDAMVQEFVKVYPTLITAQAMQLGSMFNRDDFPSPSEITSKFGWSLGYLPVPKAGDFRVDVGNEAQKELQDKLEELANKRVADAHKTLWDRLHEHLKRMSDRLQVDNIGGEEKPRKFHDTLVTGGLELCDLLKALNLTGDQDLENARKRLEKALLGLDPEDLRKDMITREGVRKEVNDIIDKFTF
jgi:uncharacterized coiled-coil protein SlyX